MVNLANDSLYHCNDMRPSKLTVYVKLERRLNIQSFEIAVLILALCRTIELLKRTHRAMKKLLKKSVHFYLTTSGINGAYYLIESHLKKNEANKKGDT
jgi:hypothetical protein